MSKTKTADQIILEKDLLVSGKYRQRKERSKKQYKRTEANKEIKEELDETYSRS
jgi:hypothetical protein